jgi:hypothetical protein
LPGFVLATSHDPGPIALADVSGDGLADIVLGNAAVGSVQVLSEPHWDGFGRELVLDVGGRIVAVSTARLDHDDSAEVVVSTDDADALWVFGGGETMDAPPKGYEVPGSPVAVGAGDVDDDGLDELFVALHDGTLGLLDVDAGASWDALVVDDTAASSVVVANDPASVVAFVDAGGRGRVWMLDAPDILELAVSSSVGIALADIDDDAPIDAVVGSAVGDPAVFAGAGSGFAAPRWLGGVGPTVAVAAADVDGDARAEVVAIGSDGRARVFDGVTLVPLAEIVLRGRPDAVAFGDVDADGYVDLVAVHKATREIELVLRER